MQFRRQNTCRMQNLGAKIGEFGCLLKMQAPHRPCTLHVTRVAGVHAIYVSPYLNLLDIEHRPDD